MKDTVQFFKPEDGQTGPGVWQPWMQDILDRINLAKGSHGGDPWAGVCLNEAIALITGQRFTDQPVCVAVPYRSHGISLNDRAKSTEQRNKLKEVIPAMVNTHPLGPDLQPIKGAEIDAKNQQRMKALTEAFTGLNLNDPDDWEQGFERFKKILTETVR